jgi:hypothetical protein
MGGVSLFKLIEWLGAPSRLSVPFVTHNYIKQDVE